MGVYRRQDKLSATVIRFDLAFELLENDHLYTLELASLVLKYETKKKFGFFKPSIRLGEMLPSIKSTDLARDEGKLDCLVVLRQGYIAGVRFTLRCSTIDGCCFHEMFSCKFMLSTKLYLSLLISC